MDIDEIGKASGGLPLREADMLDLDKIFEAKASHELRMQKMQAQLAEAWLW